MLGGRTELVLADINSQALAFSAINAVLNDLPSAKTVFSDVLEEIEGSADIIIANPPYLVDEDRRVYRHGGGELGISLALRIAEQSLARLAPGGKRVGLGNGTEGSGYEAVSRIFHAMSVPVGRHPETGCALGGSPPAFEPQSRRSVPSVTFRKPAAIRKVGDYQGFRMGREGFEPSTDGL